jgi:hypothetical protein
VELDFDGPGKSIVNCIDHLNPQGRDLLLGTEKACLLSVALCAEQVEWMYMYVRGYSFNWL